MESELLKHVLSRSAPSTPVLTTVHCHAETPLESNIRSLLNYENISIDECDKDSSDTLTISSIRTVHKRSIADLFVTAKETSSELDTEDSDLDEFDKDDSLSYRLNRGNSVVSMLSSFSNASSGGMQNGEDEWDDEEFLFPTGQIKSTSASTLPREHYPRRKMSISSQLSQLQIDTSRTFSLTPSPSQPIPLKHRRSTSFSFSLDSSIPENRLVSPNTPETSRIQRKKSLRDHPLINPMGGNQLHSPSVTQSATNVTVNNHKRSKKPKAHFFTSNGPRNPSSMIRSLFWKRVNSDDKARRFSISTINT